MGMKTVSQFIFLASAYEDGWPILSLAVSSCHWHFHYRWVG